METISSLISVQDLLKLQSEKVEVKLFDVTNGANAKQDYENQHLNNAVFVDINFQLAKIEEDVSFGGRHPLPKIEDFSKILGLLGINQKTHVVLYDRNNGANAASRFWWMLKAIGHEKVQILDGGFQAAEKFGYPINNEKVAIQEAENYPVEKWNLPLITIDEVDANKANNDFLIIDVREEKRYNGIFEPIDLIAGHIPNAVNIPFNENLDENGFFLNQKLLQEKYSTLFEKYSSKNIVVHCGSGVTACHTIFAIHYAGFEIPKLYVGSWSEWSRNNKEMVLARN